MPIYQAGEDYLEKILMLHERLGYARSVDIANIMKVTKPSVSVAVKRLRENGYVEMNDDGLITLTEQGMEVAQKIYHRHKVLTAMFQKLGVSDENAAEDACRMEHLISDESFSAICRFLGLEQ